MEKKTKKLQLRKETIAVLNGERMSHVIGGVGYCDPPYEMIEVDGGQICSIVGDAAWTFHGNCTDYCTDGCTGVTATKWNCTKGNCTADCRTIVCDTKEFCTA